MVAQSRRKKMSKRTQYIHEMSRGMEIPIPVARKIVDTAEAAGVRYPYKSLEK